MIADFYYFDVCLVLMDLAVEISDEDEVWNERTADLDIIVGNVFADHIELLGKIEDY